MKGVDQSPKISQSDYVKILNDDDPPTDITDWKIFFKKYKRISLQMTQERTQERMVGLSIVHEDEEDDFSESGLSSLSSEYSPSTKVSHPLIIDDTKIVTGLVQISDVIFHLSKSGFPPEQFRSLLDYVLSFSPNLNLDVGWVKIDDLPTPPPVTPQKKTLSMNEKQKRLHEKQKKELEKSPEFDKVKGGVFLDHCRQTITVLGDVDEVKDMRVSELYPKKGDSFQNLVSVGQKMFKKHHDLVNEDLLLGDQMGQLTKILLMFDNVTMYTQQHTTHHTTHHTPHHH